MRQLTRLTSRALHVLVGAASLLSLAALFVVAAARLTYPYELEWLEGTMLDSVRWIATGHALYGPPAIRFIPTVYNPLYFYVSAALTPVLGMSFVPLRLISILSAAALCVLLTLRLSSRSRLAGLIAAGLYAASFRFTGAWMDTAKADSLCFALLLGGFIVGRDAHSIGRHLASVVCYVLAFYTKQIALLVVAMVLVGQFATNPRRFWVPGVLFAALTAGVFILLNVMTDGWYAFFTIDTPRHFVLADNPSRFLELAVTTLLPSVLLAVGAVAAIIAERRSVGGDAGQRIGAERSSVLLFASALVVSSWVVSRQRGTYDNTFLPATLGFAMLAGLVYEICRYLSIRADRPAAVFGTQLAVIATGLLLLLQTGLFAYDPRAQLPTRADRVAGDRTVARLAALPGKVLVWDHGAYGAAAGKTSYLQGFIYADAAGWLSDPPRTEAHQLKRDQVASVYTRALHSQTFDWVVTDLPDDDWLPYYLYVGRVLDVPDVFYPVTGRRTRPESIMARNPLARGGELDLRDPATAMMLGAGWSDPEGSGRRLDHRASAIVSLEPGGGYTIAIDIAIECPAGSRAPAAIVRWNGAQLQTDSVVACGQSRLSAALPTEQITDQLNTLEMEIGSSASTTYVTHVSRIRFDRR